MLFVYLFCHGFLLSLFAFEHNNIHSSKANCRVWKDLEQTQFYSMLISFDNEIHFKALTHGG